MKKALLTMALAVGLVFVFAATAMASGGLPNRSSSGVLVKPTDTQDVGTGNNVSYIVWPTAQTGGASTFRGETQTTAWGGDAGSVHSGYSIDTVKCQVCHSAHKAGATGTKLLMSGANGCLVCHSYASNFSTTTKISTDSGGRHGADTQCTNGYCHATSPHGLVYSDIADGTVTAANIDAMNATQAQTLFAKAELSLSGYPAAQVNMLNAKSDSLIHAAIESGTTGTAQDGFILGWAGYDGAGGPIKVSVLNPVTQAMMDDTAQVSDGTAHITSVGTAVATGYTCSNNACHVNGSFNALSDTASFGVLQDSAGTTSITGESSSSSLRTQAIKGHRIGATVTSGYQNIAGKDIGQVAYAPALYCRSCHDQTDPRSSSISSFPHGQGRAFAATPDASKPDWSMGNTATSISSVWFNVASDITGADKEVTIKGGGTVAGSKYTVASDGACLKCHRAVAGDPNATPDPGVGVGYDF
ncbi:MAG: hypothetical protein FWD65_04050 [Coriobacteriia bacterium]|nr:hypothetical protein [Coriobacteriia bacterium]